MPGPSSADPIISRPSAEPDEEQIEALQEEENMLEKKIIQERLRQSVLAKRAALKTLQRQRTNYSLESETTLLDHQPGAVHSYDVVGEEDEDHNQPEHFLPNKATPRYGIPSGSRPKLPFTANGHEDTDTPADRLQQLIDISKGILAASLRREKHDVQDLEQAQTKQDECDDATGQGGAKLREEAIWARVRPWRYQRIPVWTDEEIAANSTWIEQVLADIETKHPGLMDEWADNWKDFFPSQMKAEHSILWLLKRLALLCCPYHLYRPHDDRDALRDALLGSMAYIRAIGSNLAFRPEADADFFDKFGKVMVTTILVRNKYPWKNPDGATIGDVLAQCYRYRFLEQPSCDEKDLYLKQAKLVVESIISLNVLYSVMSIGLVGWGIMTSGRSMEETLGLPLKDIIQLYRFEKAEPLLDCAKGPRFRTDDLHIRRLRSIGQLRIVWTLCQEDHLRLNVKAKTLTVCWYPSPPCRQGSDLYDWHKYLHTYRILGGGRDGLRELSTLLDHELQLSWAVLFTSTSPKRDREEYGALEQPGWFHSKQLMNSQSSLSERSKKPTMRALLNDTVKYPEMMQHVKTLPSDAQDSPDAAKHHSYRYSDFPIYEKRIRQLRAYMNAREPRGLRELWRDNRDSLNYYTFWGVIIFGACTVFLAVISVAISSAQTVAAFKALNTSPSPASSSGG